MEKRKRKINYKKIILFLLILYIIGSFIYGLITFPIKNIYVKNNKYLTDQEIIDIAKIKDYPSLVFTTKSRIINRLKQNPIINSVQVEKTILGKVTINVEENRPIFYDGKSNKYVLSNGKTTNNIFSVPILTNSMSKEIYDKFVKAMNKVDTEVLLKLSEIEYSKVEQDQERFHIITTDHIKIFVNIKNFEDLNYYNELLSTLEGKKGTWHLDYGNYFVSE